MGPRDGKFQKLNNYDTYQNRDRVSYLIHDSASLHKLNLIMCLYNRLCHSQIHIVKILFYVEV